MEEDSKKKEKLLVQRGQAERGGREGEESNKETKEEGRRSSRIPAKNNSEEKEDEEWKTRKTKGRVEQERVGNETKRIRL